MAHMRSMAVMTSLLAAILASGSAGELGVGKTGAEDSNVGNPLDYPFGDPRRCLEVGKANGYHMRWFEVLPGFGWDNLRNVGEGQVVDFNFSRCRTTDDGRFLLPDSVTAVPVKASSVHTFATLFTHWKNWTSSTSHTINVEAGLTLTHVGVSGKFSSDFTDVKAKQIGDRSVTTRAQLRYVRYNVQLQPDTPLHPAFKSRVLGVAAALELGQHDEARFLAQLLVRDFGTHIVTKADAGAALEQVDQLRQDWVMSQTEKKRDILAAASGSLFSVFKMSASYETKTDETFKKAYISARTDSNILTKGGQLFRPANFTPDAWAQALDDDLVALDRAGDPLHYVITAASLPELPASTLNEVYTQVKEAIETYYSYNTIPGCLDKESPNFAPAANVDDGSCRPPPTNLTFGGVFQTCEMQSGSNNGDLCGDLPQVNPLTGTYSCPDGYTAVQLHSGDMTSSRSEHHCSGAWFWKHCHDDYFHSRATYKFSWCAAASGAHLPQHSGYLFGGLYSAKMDNPVTQARSCPPTFFPLKIGDRSDLKVCISDDFEFGEKYSVPFAGFLSCQAGNPLAVEGANVVSASHDEAPKTGGSGHRMMLRQFFSQQADDWPKRCPDGYSRHLATVDKGCQINYCVMTGAMAGPLLPPVKRPPFVAAPPVPPPSPDNLVMFDAQTRTWKKNADAQAIMLQPAFKRQGEVNSLSPGAAAGISVFATLACVALATLAVVAVRARSKARSQGTYRRLQSPLLEPRTRGGYGGVETAAPLLVSIETPEDTA